MRTIVVPILLLMTMACCKSKSRRVAEEIVSSAPDPIYMNAGNEKYDLTIPAGWTTAHREVYGVDYYYLIAPQTKDDANTNINVASEFMQNLTLENYLAGTIESLKKSIQSVVVTAQGEVVANGIKGVWYSYTMEPQGIKASLVSYIFPKDGIAYIITAGTQMKDAVKYRRIFDDVAQSFIFK